MLFLIATICTVAVLATVIAVAVLNRLAKK
jgi:hypothetical protein